MPSPTASRGTTPVTGPGGRPGRLTGRLATGRAGRGPRRAPTRPRVRWSTRRPVRLLVGLGLTLVALLLGAPPASAHAALTSSDPAQGAVVSSAPEEVVLSFSEGVSMSDDAIRVLGPKGDRADTGAPRDVGRGGETSYAVSLRSGLPNGTYTVAWRAVSADSHPVSGAFTFSVGAPSKTSVDLDPPAAGGGLVGALYHVARYAAYTGFVLLVGGAAFVLACWPHGSRVRQVRRVVTGGWATLTGSTLALLVLRAPYTESGRLAGVFDLAALRDVLGTKTGTALLCRLLLLAAAALFVTLLFGRHAERSAVRRAARGTGPHADLSEESGSGSGSGSGSTSGSTSGSGSGPRAEPAAPGRTAEERRGLAFGLASGGLLVAVGLAATWAMAEHASTGVQPRLAMPVDVLHLLAVAFWLGGLTSLVTALYRGPRVPVAVVRRFSRIAFWSVVALAATGVYQSWRQVGSWSALVLTDFGQLLLVKVGLIAVLLGFASLSRSWTAELASPARRDGVAEGTDVADTSDAPPGAGTAGETSEGEEPVVAAEAGATTGGRPGAETGGEPGAEPARDGAPHPGRAEGRAADQATPLDPVRTAQLTRQRQARARAQERRQRERNVDPVRSGLRRSVLAEAGIALIVLLVTTMLTTTEPGRTEESTQPTGGQRAARTDNEPISLSVPFDTGGPRGQGTAQVQLTPGASGANALHVRVQGAKGEPLDVPELKAALTNEESGIGPLSAVLHKVDAGHWTASGVQLPMPGRWVLALTVRTSDVDQVTEKREVRIG